MNDEFELWNFPVEVVGDPESMECGHQVGDNFEVSNEDLRFPAGQSFSMYALSAILPLCASPAADAFASADEKLTSVTCLPARQWVSERSLTRSGWSASCMMI